MKIRDTLFFKNTPPILPTPPFLWEKFETPFFPKISKTQLSFIKEGGGDGGFQLCLRFDAFDFQLKFILRYTNFVRKGN